MITRTSFHSRALIEKLQAQLAAALAELPGTGWKPKGWPLPCTIAGHRSMKRPCLRSPPVAQANPELALQPGKCVVAKPKGSIKGLRSPRLWQRRLFRGGRPFFLGMTDR